ncbi:hypothetical protein N752_30310 [Desulforamulus aquiferis]|nr:hypothetical protein [Desulforamulus aquiferis]RYD01292.1 hypothetical protein N752_30310 [Desulforamulus aquiferis]
MWPFENSLKNQLRSQDLMKKYREWLKRWNFKGNRLNVLLFIGLALAVTMLSAYGIYNWKYSTAGQQASGTIVVNESAKENLVSEPADSFRQLEQETIIPEVPINPEEMVKPVMGHVLTNVGIAYSDVFQDYRYNTGIALEANPGSEVKAAWQEQWH